MLDGLVGAVRFGWSATRGARWRPWQSDYLRWRLETYSGKPADEVRGKDFLRLMWVERRQFWSFLRWTGAMRRLAEGDEE